MAKKTYSNKTTVKSKPKKATKKIKPRGGGPNNNAPAKVNNGPRKLKP